MNLFSIPFFQYDIDDWKDKKQKLLEICSTIDFKNYDTGEKNELGVNADNLYTDYNTNNDHIYRNQVVHILKKELQKFKNDCNLEKMSVGNVWFQQYYKKQFHSPHTHGAIGYSSVVYIKFDKDKHQPTIFLSPFNDPEGKLIEYAPKVDEGQIIFFPSMITHYVSPNPSNHIRIILSFNIGAYQPKVYNKTFIPV